MHLVLTAEANPPVQGNLLLDRLFGAIIHFVPPPADPTLATSDEEAAKVAEVMADLRARASGRTRFPVGGSSGVGVLGYTYGTREIVDQLAAIERTSDARCTSPAARAAHRRD